MVNWAKNPGATIRLMRPVVPAKDFEVSRRFYADLGFEERVLADGLVEMRLGACTFILQRYYVAEWANHFAIHLTVSDVKAWWEKIESLQLPIRYGVKTQPPRQEDWGVVAGVVDPSGVLWRFAEIPSGRGAVTE